MKKKSLFLSTMITACILALTSGQAGAEQHPDYPTSVGRCPTAQGGPGAPAYSQYGTSQYGSQTYGNYPTDRFSTQSYSSDTSSFRYTDNRPGSDRTGKSWWSQATSTQVPSDRGTYSQYGSQSYSQYGTNGRSAPAYGGTYPTGERYGYSYGYSGPVPGSPQYQAQYGGPQSQMGYGQSQMPQYGQGQMQYGQGQNAPSGRCPGAAPQGSYGQGPMQYGGSSQLGRYGYGQESMTSSKPLQTTSTEKITGTVQSVNKMQYPDGSQTEIIVTTNEGTKRVMLGPSRFIETQKIKIQSGDKVTINAFKAGANGQTTYIAQDITRNGNSLSLRNDDRMPQWGERPLEGNPTMGGSSGMAY